MVKSKGTVKFFNSQKGFGFIVPESGERELFVHANSIEGNEKTLREGQKVLYFKVDGRKGPEASEVEDQ